MKQGNNCHLNQVEKRVLRPDNASMPKQFLAPLTINRRSLNMEYFEPGFRFY